MGQHECGDVESFVAFAISRLCSPGSSSRGYDSSGLGVGSDVQGDVQGDVRGDVQTDVRSDVQGMAGSGEAEAPASGGWCGRPGDSTFEYARVSKQASGALRYTLAAERE